MQSLVPVERAFYLPFQCLRSNAINKMLRCTMYSLDAYASDTLQFGSTQKIRVSVTKNVAKEQNPEMFY